MKFKVGDWVTLKTDDCRCGKVVAVHRGERCPYEVRIAHTGVLRFRESDLEP